jgi:hypothetical protein
MRLRTDTRTTRSTTAGTIRQSTYAGVEPPAHGRQLSESRRTARDVLGLCHPVGRRMAGLGAALASRCG